MSWNDCPAHSASLLRELLGTLGVETTSEGRDIVGHDGLRELLGTDRALFVAELHVARVARHSRSRDSFLRSSPPHVGGLRELLGTLGVETSRRSIDSTRVAALRELLGTLGVETAN